MNGPSGGVTGHGGFLAYPSGTFRADAGSSGGYDRQKARWLPVNHAAISPDGSRYAWAEVSPAGSSGGPRTGIVHIVDVDGGAPHDAHSPGPVGVVAWTATGIYVDSVVPESGAPRTGLSVINPDTLAFHQLTSAGTWQLVGDNYAWSVDINPTDPHPPVQNGPGPRVGNRVERLELTTATVTSWFTFPGSSVFLLGLDLPAQNPWIGATQSGQYNVIGGSQSQTIQLSSPVAFDGGAAFADATGTWFANLTGRVYHYGSADNTLQQVATLGFQSPALAGPCM